MPMARHFRGSGHIVRFIEYMDVGATNGWRMDDVVPAAEIVALIDAELPLASVDPNYRGEVAERWRYRDGSGEIGVIASVTQAFCRDCTRAAAVDRRQALHLPVRHRAATTCAACCASGHDDDAIARAIAAIWRQRGDRYSEIRTANTRRSPKVEMSYIGG